VEQFDDFKSYLQFIENREHQKSVQMRLRRNS
jgi:hypothetical protein